MKTILTPPHATSRLSDWIYYIQHKHKKIIDLGLDRIRHVATSLNLLRPAPYVITVGGTNGKSTTCRMLESIFLAHGIRVGVYTSPYLLRYTEQVRIQGNELSDTIHSEAMAVIEEGRGAISLSYFEFSTLVALLLFQQAELDIVILEVGLGGRLDATNIINSDIAVITSIALDHTHLLGSDRSSIAREKAGIFRCGKPAVIGEIDRPKTLDCAISDSGAQLYAYGRDWWWEEYERDWCWWDKKNDFNMLPLPSIPIENAAVALAVVRCLPFTVLEKALLHGLREATLQGRFQFLSVAPLIILDVAHNPHSAHYLSKRLSTLPLTGKVRAVVGMFSDKDIAGTLTCLRQQVDAWYCASLYGVRAAHAAQLTAYLDESSAKQFEDVLSALHEAIADSVPEDCILVFGSFYAVAPVLKLFEKKKYSDK